jgi:hypothetical protein
VATPTLANSSSSLQSSIRGVRPFPPLTQTKSQPRFLVFPCQKAKFNWQIVSLGTSRTISRHKSLSFALRKCTSLNKQRRGGPSHEIN